jgi:hypothetical protein
VYEYRWPLNEQEEIKFIYIAQCSVSEIAEVEVSPSFKKIYVYSKNSNVLQMGIVQYVDGE